MGGSNWNYATAPTENFARATALGRVCKSHNVPLPAAALQLPLAHSVVASVVPGKRSPKELMKILNWWEVDIPPALWAKLKSEGLIDVASPVPR